MIYTLHLSNKEEITISEKELQKFKENISANFIEFEEGIINPSFVVSVTVDHDASKRDNLQKLGGMGTGTMGDEDTKLISAAYSQGNLKEIKTMSSVLAKYEKLLLPSKK